MRVAALPGVSLFFLVKRRAHIYRAETCMEFIFSPECRKSINKTFLPLLFLFVCLMGGVDLGTALLSARGSGGFSRGRPCLWVNPVGHSCMF